MAKKRQLGVHARNLPVKKTFTVRASDFAIGGMLGNTERKYLRTYAVKSENEFAEIFGDHISSSNYLPDCVRGFFSNTYGVDATLYIQSTVGYNVGTDAVDAVVASRTKIDVGSYATAYTVKPAYLDELEYGLSGNRTGTYFTQIDRFTTAAAATCAATGVSFATLDSVADIKVGDLIKFHTGALGASKVFKIVTQIDEAAKKVYWTGNFEVSGGSGETLGIDDVVTIPGFTVKTYRKTLTGIEYEVDKDLGKIICSSEAAVTDYYVENVFKNSKYIQITEASNSTLGGRLPVSDSSITYCTSGADGTAIATVEALNYHLAKFDLDPIRFIAYPESTTVSYQQALITYSLTRDDDNPIVIVNAAEDRTKTQLIEIGNGYQKSDFEPAVIVANWLGVTDPFTTSSIAQARHVPNVGHVMGAWIRGTETLGIHRIPCTQEITLNGVVEIIGDQFLDDDDRTDLSDAGINMIQEISGVGFKIMNLYTISTATEYNFANGILMRNYIKVAVVDSLHVEENMPNTLVRIQNSKSKIDQWMLNLWNRGSTGNVPIGETFGQQIINGIATGPFDHFEVVADNINNPQPSLNLGEQNYTIYFTYPTPASSIQIGVGILLK